MAKKNYKKKIYKRPFGAVEISTFQNDEWMLLKPTPALIYIILKTFYKGDGKPFQAPFDEIKKRSLIKQGGTIINAIKYLEERNWITVTRYAKHGKGRGLRVKPNLYTLTWSFDLRRW